MEPPTPVNLDVSRDPGRYFSDYASDLARNYPGERIIVHVPFDGEGDVFKVKTSMWTTTFPCGRVRGNDLLLTRGATAAAAPATTVVL
ncbi:MAG: hypothetical protein M3295_08650 [Chloroflexota bacterium]|nr:hypothetical protein [Chloroflexota bacterium]